MRCLGEKDSLVEGGGGWDRRWMVRWADQIRCRYLWELSDDVEMNELRRIIVYHSDSFLNPEPGRDRVESIKVLLRCLPGPSEIFRGQLELAKPHFLYDRSATSIDKLLCGRNHGRPNHRDTFRHAAFHRQVTLIHSYMYK